MNGLCLTFLVLCMTSVIYSELNKCCKSNIHFENNNGTFKCSKHSSNVSQILTNNTNFLKHNTEGQCVEFLDNFYIFSINDSTITQLEAVQENVYPKCCPLNLVYNTDTHSCEKDETAKFTDINENYVKIGLPECNIIVDHIIDNITENDYQPGNYTSFLNSYCIDRNINGNFVSRKCENTQKICSKMRCVQKCCTDGQSYKKKNKTWKCIEGYQGINLTEMSLRNRSELPEEPFAIVITNKYPDPFLLNETRYPSFLNSKGVFSYTIQASQTIRRNSSRYCVEHTENGTFFFLSVDRSKQAGYAYFSYLQLISSILLILTILIYFLLNEVQKMFGKILVNYNLAVLIWYAQLAYLYIILPEKGCVRAAFIVFFARTASFVWSNVMCWDIWRTFGSTSGYNDTFRKNNNYKKIIIYCSYGWGAPLVLTLLIYLFYSYDKILPYTIQPIIGKSLCFFDKEPGNYAQLVFLDMPTILLQVINIVLFVKTVMYCIKVKNEINRINDNIDKKENFKRNKAKLFLILKLLLIMGVTFITEAITTSIDMIGKTAQIIDRIFNIINASQGIFIFLIFICNQQMYNNLKKKFKIFDSSCSGSTESVTTQTSTDSVQSSNNSANNSSKK